MPHDLRCIGRKADGSACGAPPGLVDPETGFCPAHDPDKREALLEAARKGGHAKAEKDASRGLDPDELPPLQSPETAELWLERIARAVTTGRLGHHEASAATRAIREWLRAWDAGTLKERLQDLRQMMDELKAEMG